MYAIPFVVIKKITITFAITENIVLLESFIYVLAIMLMPIIVRQNVQDLAIAKDR